MEHAADRTSLEAAFESPLPTLALGLIAGQAWAGARHPLPLLAAAGMIVFASGLLCSRRWRRVGFAVLLGLFGVHQVERAMRLPDEPDHVARFAPGKVRVRARVGDVPEQLENKWRVLLEVEAVQTDDWHEAHGQVLATFLAMREPWPQGAIAEGIAHLRRPRNFGNPGEFDYEGYLARRGVFATAFAVDDRGWSVAPPRGGAAWIDFYRGGVAEAFAHQLDSPAREILGALILGNAGGVPRAIREEFAIAGVSHVLSISGLHVALVAGGAYLALYWLLARSRRLLLLVRVPKLATIGSFAAVVFYVWLARGSVPTVRALVMIALVGSAVLLNRQRDTLVSVAAAALVISLWWPGSVRDISFQLSFVSVVAIVVAVEIFWRRWRRFADRRLLHLRGRRWRWIAAAGVSLVVTLAASVATAPLAALHFNQVSLAAPIANPIAVPLLGTIAVAAGLVAAVAVGLWQPLAWLPIAIAGGAIDLSLLVIRWIAQAPFAAVRTVTPTAAEIGCFYAVLLATFAVRGRRRVALAGLAVLLVGAVLLEWRQRRAGDLEVTFVSVGQGDATIVRFPDGTVMLVDGGGLAGMDTGARIVGPQLWWRRLSRVDVVVLTHAQRDHYGGLAFVVDTFGPREFWHGGTETRSPGFDDLRGAVGASGATELRVSAGERRKVGGCEVDVLGPPRDRCASPNDCSVVLRIDCGGGASLLLPGDLERDGERRILDQGDTLRSRVLKVAHHGSRTSSTARFVQGVMPEVAVVSAGYRNRFGFPDEGVLAVLAAEGARVYRTDLDGAVTVRMSSDGALGIFTGHERNGDVDSPNSRDYGRR